MTTTDTAAEGKIYSVSARGWRWENAIFGLVEFLDWSNFWIGLVFFLNSSGTKGGGGGGGETEPVGNWGKNRESWGGAFFLFFRYCDDDERGGGSGWRWAFFFNEIGEGK